MNKKHLLAVVAATLAGLSLTACGDDVTEVNEIHQDGMAVLEAGEKLSKQACDTTNVGEMLFVTDSSAAFVCDGKSWQTLKGEKGEDGGKGNPGKDGDNGTGCTSKSVKNAAGLEGLEVTCGETVIDTIWNGKNGKDGEDGDNGTSCTAKSVKNKSGLEGLEVTCGETVIDTIWNGKNGKDGEDGDNGTSCTAKSVKNKSGLEGVEVTCGETVIDTIWNGKDGQNGNNGTSCTATVNQDGGFDLVCDGQTVGTITNGEDGVGCTLDDEGDGTVKVTCGEGDDETITNIYKAVCGTKPYDPAKSFCSEGTLYSCDDKPYDPAKSFCSKGTLYSCDDKPYDPKKQFCKQGSTVKDYGWLTDTRDKQIYKTVKIGDQTWMAENLNYSVNPGEQSWCGGGEAGKKNEGDCSVYGRLYTWAAAVGKTEAECGYEHECDLTEPVQGVCPEGWHLPSNDEWNALFTAVGGTSYAGQKLKADSDLWYEGTSNDDSFGFAVLPAGHRGNNGSFNDEGNVARFWSSTGDDSYNADYWYFFYDYDDVRSSWDIKFDGFSVRCLRDSN